MKNFKRMPPFLVVLALLPALFAFPQVGRAQADP